MLTLNGQILNIFPVPEFKDKKTGEITPARFRIQLMGQTLTPTGDKKVELVNLTVQDDTPYRSLLGKSARIPVGVFVAAGAAQFFALKATAPEPLA